MSTIVERLFTAHPASVGESYLQHLWFATRTGAMLVALGLAAIVHGLFPCLFERTCSEAILRMASGMRSRNTLRRGEESKVRMHGDGGTTTSPSVRRSLPPRARAVVH